ncbi:hypothetical protein PAUR_a2685 [Pseudoalteromonas aurantia 208]|uniref:Uncharacterized protein n=1 Tax=Pseudoalteromonas aurantia 208 TaxID=1314867 RepID=A0ABR9EDQ0_9GAMM|nr:hypothetical protein [Pseudoalteromonas aurantia 208]
MCCIIACWTELLLAQAVWVGVFMLLEFAFSGLNCIKPN